VDNDFAPASARGRVGTDVTPLKRVAAAIAQRPSAHGTPDQKQRCGPVSGNPVVIHVPRSPSSGTVEDYYKHRTTTTSKTAEDERRAGALGVRGPGVWRLCHGWELAAAARFGVVSIALVSNKKDRSE
jgi:hypothetical protein